MTALRQRMREDLRIRNYAPTTVSSYIRPVAEFAQHFNKPPDRLGAEEVRSWQLFPLNEKRGKLSTYIQAICALRFFYQNTLHRRIEIDRILAVDWKWRHDACTGRDTSEPGRALRIALLQRRRT